jgi:hypothetical protein
VAPTTDARADAPAAKNDGAAADAPPKGPPGDDGTDATPPGDDDATPPGDDGSDASGDDDGATDAGPDATPPVDASTDADDSGFDAGHDAGIDAGFDAGFDAGHDAGFDAGFDAGHDAGIDTGVDSGCATGGILVNEVQVAGSGGSEDEWVELRNGGTCPVDLTGWTLRHTSTTGTSIQTVWTAASASIAGRGYALVAGMTYSGSVTPIGKFNTGVLAATGGGLGLYDANGTLRDSMGYGTGATNPFVKGSPAAASPSGESMARTPDGSNGGDDSVDFAIATTPTPGAAN